MTIAKLAMAAVVSMGLCYGGASAGAQQTQTMCVGKVKWLTIFFMPRMVGEKIVALAEWGYPTYWVVNFIEPGPVPYRGTLPISSVDSDGTNHFVSKYGSDWALQAKFTGGTLSELTGKEVVNGNMGAITNKGLIFPCHASSTLPPKE